MQHAAPTAAGRTASHAARPAAATPAAAPAVARPAATATRWLDLPGHRAPAARVSMPDDPAEREAEAFADAVMQDGRAPPLPTQAPDAALQRQCAAPCACDEAVTPTLHPQAEVAGARAPHAATMSSIQAMRGQGQPLPPALRGDFEPRLQRSLLPVRVHTGSGAAAAARDLHARAFTHGADVFFAERQYRPETPGGRRLLAHEMAHVAQGAPGVHRQATDPADAGVATVAGDAGADLAAGGTSTFDPGVVGMDGRPSTASPLASATPAPPPGPDAIGWFGDLLSPDEAYLQHQVRARMAAAPTLAEGEQAVEAWVGEFEASISRAAYGADDVAGVSDLSAAQRVWVDRARRVLPVLRSAILHVQVEHIVFEREFLVRGELVIGGLLDLSLERVESEAARYGIVRHSRTTTRMEHDGLARVAVPTVIHSYSMSGGAGTAGLAAAAAALAAQARAVEARTREAWAQIGPVPAPAGTYGGAGDTGTVLGVLDAAAYAAATGRKTEARRAYDLLRFEKERDFPILSAYATLPADDALWPLASAAERLEGLAQGATADNAQLLFNEIDEKRRNIARTGEALRANDLVLWELQPALSATAADMALAPDSWEMRWVREAAARHASHRSLVDIALGVLALGLGLLAAIPTGGSSLVAAGVFVAGAGAAGLSTYFAVTHLQQYLLDSAASGTDFDKARAVSSADPSLFWLAVDIVGAVVDIHAAASAFRALSASAREALAMRRAAASADEVARGEAAIEAAARRADELHPGQGLGDRVREGLRREAAREGRGAEAAVREWEAGINSESRAFLVDHPDLRLRYTEMPPRVRQALTFCASVCVVPSATAAQANRLDTLLARWGEGDLTRLQQYLHAHADDLEPALARLETAADWPGVQHVLGEELHAASFAPGDNPLANLTDAEIDTALDEMFSPALAGGARPTIEGHRVPLRTRRRLDIQSIPRRAGETARDALARVRQVMGKRLDEIDAVRNAWERARQRVLSQHTLGPDNYADLYDRTRRVFWSEVRNDAEASSHFSRAGFEFPGGEGTAPMLRTPADVSATEIRVSLDHIAEKAIGDNWRYALDADNLRMEFAMPNTYREIIQARHPELR